MKFLCLLLALSSATQLVLSEEWSWSGDSKASSESSKVVFKDDKGDRSILKELVKPQQLKPRRPLPVVAPSVEPKEQKRQARKIEDIHHQQQPVAAASEAGKSEGRFFGLKKGLCKHGLGVNVRSLNL